MRILQLGKFFPFRGGVEKVMQNLCIGFSTQGIHCDILTASANGKTDPVHINSRCTIFRTKTIYKMMATMLSPKMITTLRKIQANYDIIHIHHPDPMATLALFLSGFKGKVVVHWHSDIVRQKVALILYRPLQNWLLKRADIVLCTSPAYAGTEHLAEVQDKIAILPIGIEEMTPSHRWVQSIQNDYIGKKIIFSMGRLVSYKGFEYLIQAAQYLSDDYVILIGGRGPLYNKLKTLISDLNVEEKVKLLGTVPNETLPSYYGAAKLFCLSSIERTEAFAIVQVEAMACGTPIVATTIDGSGVPWVNKTGVSGLNVPTRNASALAEAIQTICDDDKTHAEYSQRARQRFEELFQLDTMVQNCQEIYQKLLANS